MAFVVTFDTEPQDTDGKFLCMRGSYVSSGGSTGGVIATGLQQVWDFQIIPTGVATQACPVVNGTFPSGGNVTIVTDANASGFFKATGR